MLVELLPEISLSVTSLLCDLAWFSLDWSVLATAFVVDGVVVASTVVVVSLEAVFVSESLLDSLFLFESSFSVFYEE